LPCFLGLLQSPLSSMSWADCTGRKHAIYSTVILRCGSDQVTNLPTLLGPVTQAPPPPRLHFCPLLHVPFPQHYPRFF
jgi:hypothetical protein